MTAPKPTDAPPVTTPELASGRVKPWRKAVQVIGERSPALRNIAAAQDRERKQVLVQLATVRGFMPLLMKVRNGGRWSADERRQLSEQLKALGHLSPYLVIMVMPGSFLALPLLAWWLDRRRVLRSA